MNSSRSLVRIFEAAPLLLTAHGSILAVITSTGLSVDILTALSATHDESKAITCDCSDHVCWDHIEKHGGNSPLVVCSRVLPQGIRVAYRTLILMASKSILPLLQWILLMELPLDSEAASGINKQLADNSAAFLFSEYTCLAISTIIVVLSLFFAAWTFPRQGLHWIVYWSCLPLLILATSWTHVGGSPANFALIQLPLCVSVGTSLTEFQRLIVYRYQSGHRQPLDSTTVEKAACHSNSEG